MGAVVDNIGNRGGEPNGVGGVLQVGGGGGTYFWVIDLGDEPPHGPVPGGGLAQGSHMDHSEASPEASGKKLVVPTSRDGDAGGGFLRDGGIYSEEAEYGCAIHCNTVNYVPLRVNCAYDRDVDCEKVVGSGETVHGRSEVGSGDSRI